MRVCIDIKAAIAQRAGVGRYAKALVEHLGEADVYHFPNFIRPPLARGLSVAT